MKEKKWATINYFSNQLKSSASALHECEMFYWTNLSQVNMQLHVQQKTYAAFVKRNTLTESFEAKQLLAWPCFSSLYTHTHINEYTERLKETCTSTCRWDDCGEFIFTWSTATRYQSVPWVLKCLLYFCSVAHFSSSFRVVSFTTIYRLIYFSLIRRCLVFDRKSPGKICTCDQVRLIK